MVIQLCILNRTNNKKTQGNLGLFIVLIIGKTYDLLRRTHVERY